MNTMGAFFSGTDDRDEKENRVFGVFGQMRNPNPAALFRVCASGQHHDIRVDDIFEYPVPELEIGSNMSAADVVTIYMHFIDWNKYKEDNTIKEWVAKCKSPATTTYPSTYPVHQGAAYGDDDYGWYGYGGQYGYGRGRVPAASGNIRAGFMPTVQNRNPHTPAPERKGYGGIQSILDEDPKNSTYEAQVQSKLLASTDVRTRKFFEEEVNKSKKDKKNKHKGGNIVVFDKSAGIMPSDEIVSGCVNRCKNIMDNMNITERDQFLKLVLNDYSRDLAYVVWKEKQLKELSDEVRTFDGKVGK